MTAYAATDHVTWNPMDKGSGVTLSNGNLTATISGLSSGVRASLGKSSGKWYWEYTIDTMRNDEVGIANKSTKASWIYNGAYGDTAKLYSYRGSIYPNGHAATPQSNNSIIGIALDMDNRQITFYCNGVVQGDSVDISKMASEVYPFIVNNSSHSSSKITANFGATSFLYSIPNGYLPYESEQVSAPADLNALKLVLEVNEEKQLSVSEDLINNIEMTWTSSDTSIATVDENGKVKALKPGNTVITCTSKDWSYTEKINILIVNLEYQLAVDLTVGDTCRLTVGDLTNTSKTTWTTYDSEIVTVSSKGKLTAVNEGLTYITATDEQGNEIGRIYIRVRK